MRLTFAVALQHKFKSSTTNLPPTSPCTHPSPTQESPNAPHCTFPLAAPTENAEILWERASVSSFSYPSSGDGNLASHSIPAKLEFPVQKRVRHITLVTGMRHPKNGKLGQTLLFSKSLTVLGIKGTRLLFMPP